MDFSSWKLVSRATLRSFSSAKPNLKKFNATIDTNNATRSSVQQGGSIEMIASSRLHAAARELIPCRRSHVSHVASLIDRPPAGDISISAFLRVS